jgi:hypothetical protein
VRAHFDGGAFLEAAYFTSEADARANESSAEFSQAQQDYMAQFDGMTFTDLPNPIFSQEG